MHSKEPPAPAPEKAKEAELELEGSLGWLSIVVSGAAVSIVQVKLAGVGSTLPAASIARTEKVWEPSASEL